MRNCREIHRVVGRRPFEHSMVGSALEALKHKLLSLRCLARIVFQNLNIGAKAQGCGPACGRSICS